MRVHFGSKNENIDSFRGFIEKFSLFLNHGEALVVMSICLFQGDNLNIHSSQGLSVLNKRNNIHEK